MIGPILKKIAGGRIRPAGLSVVNPVPYRWATTANWILVLYKICIYIQYGVSDHTTLDLCNPAIQILI